MRRRERDPVPTLPAELASFDPDSWRDRGGIEGWLAARLEWVGEHRGEIDAIPLYRENVRMRRAHLRESSDAAS